MRGRPAVRCSAGSVDRMDKKSGCTKPRCRAKKGSTAGRGCQAVAACRSYIVSGRGVCGAGAGECAAAGGGPGGGAAPLRRRRQRPSPQVPQVIPSPPRDLPSRALCHRGDGGGGSSVPSVPIEYAGVPTSARRWPTNSQRAAIPSNAGRA